MSREAARSAVPPAPGQPDARLKRLEQLSYYLDNAIPLPGLRYRIGYDALIGLIPGVGDLVGLAISAYIVLEAARFRLPFSTVLRMVANVGIEALVGSVPLVGDLFDATWKANARNMALLRERLDGDRRRAVASDRRFFGGVALVLLLALAALGVAVVYLLRALLGLLGG